MTAPDGRAARAERTRARIVAATVELIMEDAGAPTSRRIARRAGIAERTLYLHFPDLEALHAAVADHHFRTVAAGHRGVAADLPLDERIHRFVLRRGRVLETMTPLRRIAMRYEHDSPALQGSRRRWTDAARGELMRTFGGDLQGAGTLAAAQAMTSWAAWNELRVAQGLSPREAVAAMELALRKLLV